MKNKLSVLCLAIFLSLINHSIAQNKSKLVNINSKDTINNLIDNDFNYLFPKFIEGTVVFKSKEIGSGYLNYNLLEKEMHFTSQNNIRENSPTQVINQSDIKKLSTENVEAIFVGDIQFINTSKGLLIKLTDLPINLLQKKEVKIGQKIAVGAYGAPVTTGSVGTFNNNDNTVNYNISRAEHQEYTLKTYYYLSNGSKTVLILNDKQFFKLFPDKEETIKQFIKERKVDFDSESSLIELTIFCNSLK